MSKEQEFKERFVSLLENLQREGTSDGETMAMIGSLAADIARELKQTSWSGAKAALTTEGYDELLKSFQHHGNALHQNGNTKQAYATQVLGISLVARTQRADADLATGEKLLDALIDTMVSRVIHLDQTRPN